MQMRQAALLSKHFDGNGMHTLVNENLQGIIHKAVAGHTRQTRKVFTGNTHPKVAAMPLRVGACMARMGRALVNHL